MSKTANKLIFILILICLWLVPQSALAQGGGLGIMPSQIEGGETRSWFVYTMNKGESREDSITINNHSDKSKTVVIEFLDAISTTDGSYSLVESRSKNQDIGKWVDLEESTFVLSAGSSREIKFTVTVPNDASVGEHNGGIVVYEKPKINNSDIKIITRVAARMYITVPGKIERNIEFEEVDYEIQDGQLIFNIKAQNDSNVKLEPALSITLSGLLSSRTQEENNNGVFLAGKEMDITETWDRPAPRFGFYRVKLILSTWTMEQTMPDGTVSKIPNLDFTYSFNFWVGSLYMVWLLLILILFWITYRVVVYLGDRSKYILDTEVYVVKKGDTIMHISERTGVFPRVLVKLNQLRWPYVINAKDKLLVPRGRLSAGKLYQKRISDPMPSFWIYLLSWRISLYHPSAGKSDK